MNQGECLFEQYLAHSGYNDFDYERTDLNPPKKPDYLVRTAHGEVVVELESFEVKGLFENLPLQEVASQPIDRALIPVWKAIYHGAQQLKGIRDRALVVVLANPKNRILPLDPLQVISAMYGDLGWADSDNQPLSADWHVGRNGRLHRVNERGVAHGYHDYISAVAVVRVGENVKTWAEEWWKEHGASYQSPAAAIPDLRAAEATGAPTPAITLDVFEALSDQCVPLPAPLFAHEGDRRWGVVAPGQYGLISGESTTGVSGLRPTPPRIHTFLDQRAQVRRDASKEPEPTRAHQLQPGEESEDIFPAAQRRAGRHPLVVDGRMSSRLAADIAGHLFLRRGYEW